MSSLTLIHTGTRHLIITALDEFDASMLAGALTSAYPELDGFGTVKTAAGTSAVVINTKADVSNFYVVEFKAFCLGYMTCLNEHRLG